MKDRRFCSCINFNGAALMIWVSMTIHIYWSFVPGGSIYSELKQAQYYPVYLVSIFQIFYPLFGWIADAWIGRYRAISIGLYLLIIGCVLLTGSVIINDIKPLVSQVILYASKVFNSLGIAAIYANIFLSLLTK